jgi:hypothetical protein
MNLKRRVFWLCCLVFPLMASAALPAGTLAGSRAAKTYKLRADGAATPFGFQFGSCDVRPECMNGSEVSNYLTGNSNLLGKWHGASHVGVNPPDGDGSLHAEGLQLIEAADGSTLQIYVTGDFPNGFAKAGINGTYEIQGGTGRFANASGTGVFLFFDVDPATGIRPVGYRGEITF